MIHRHAICVKLKLTFYDILAGSAEWNLSRATKPFFLLLVFHAAFQMKLFYILVYTFSETSHTNTLARSNLNCFFFGTFLSYF